MKRRYIVVEGPIGVGKSSLVKALQGRLNAQVVNDVNNPFLPAFYQDMEKYAFQTQLFFLLSRFQQQQELSQGELFSDHVLCDYLLQKDRLFASLNLSSAEFALYEKVYSLLKGTMPKPDVIVYLQADVDSLLSRIAKRGDDLAVLLPKKYLEHVVEAYQTFFFHYHQCPVIVCNTQKGYFQANEAHIDILLKKIVEVKTGLHYLNPQET